MLKARSHSGAALSLFMLVPAANIGIAARFYLPGEVGQFLFVLTRVWILALPLIWFFKVDQDKPVVSLPSRQELLAGTTLGLLMFSAILSAYWLVGQFWINPVEVRAKAQQVGINSLTLYLVGAFYFTFINALIEECIWRQFVYRKCEILIPGIGAVCLAALCFTLHHVIALTAFTRSWVVVVLGSLGVFIAGAVWSWCYLTYRSLWSCYISHMLADLAIALIGWHLLFS